MTFWNIVQAISSALGGLTFFLVVFALLFNEKLKDWFVQQAELRRHRLDVVREHDRSNTELRSKIVLELFNRKIKAHDAIRLGAMKIIETATLAKVVASDQSNPANSQKVEAIKQSVMDLLNDFQRSYRTYEADLSKTTIVKADAFGESIAFELFPDLKEKYAKRPSEKSVPARQAAKELFGELHAELHELYSEGFEKLIKPR
jgi:hypothetical protein